MTQHYLSPKEVAERIGVEPETVRTYAARGRMPEPDATIGFIKGWLPETIDEWAASRPGQGRWGPRKLQHPEDAP
ncbi:helix-turn-helix transcriptional regulator [Microbacterium sp. No. 7]|uniref:helix-turn-helix transcriptional regulator n=1 Tax=Microbacterium sp. No. 7 TaxID=1714373 RepID=UPI0018D015EF|nr:helix-turn-helix domain-containing protein [Microbacterium sp. No. 7]